MSASMFPYDRNDECFMQDGESLKGLIGISDSVARATLAFGQSDSSYCDTGYPEMTAVGIRAFLSVPANVRMMQELGEARLGRLVDLGVNVLYFGYKDFKEYWDKSIEEIKNADERTYNYVMNNVKAEIKKQKAQVAEEKKKAPKKKRKTKVRRK